MTLNDLLKRVLEEDKDKMLLYTDGKGWANVNIRIDDSNIWIFDDECNSPFSSDK